MEQQARWHRVQDLALALSVAGIGLLEIWAPLESAMGSGSRVVGTLGVTVVATLLTQRRSHPLSSVLVLAFWPVLLLLAAGNVQILFFGQLVPIVLAVYSVARHGQGRLPWVGAIAAAVLLLSADLFIDLLRSPGEIVFHWGVVTIAFLAGRGLRDSEDRAAAAAVRAMEAENATRERARAAVAEERGRIARELHDIVAHSVSVMVVQAGAAEQVVADDPEFARRALGTIRTTGTGALDEMRRVVAMLRAPEPADLTPQPGVQTLPVLVDAARDAGLEVDLTINGGGPLPAGLDLTAYRIVQEALTNVRRHSAADRAAVCLSFTGEALEISVIDDGPARDGAGEPGHGIIGMRERTVLFGGSLDTSTDGSGFSVRAVLPLEAR
ncbi:MAG: sensor histidine kinase [Actinomycetota bacterium]|nr:sensor histidine kinase [Actinomycetota bacterium]